MKAILFILMTVLVSMNSWSAIPTKINYVGTLADGGGNLVNATLSIEFKLYEQDTGGTAIWSETQSVEVIEGSFSVELGSENPLSFELFDTSVYLSMNVNNDGEMSPRQPFNTVPYTFKADTIYDQIIVARGSDSAAENGQKIIDALPLLAAATPDKPMLLLLEPGLFDLGNQGLVLSEHVHLKGFGTDLTEITSAAQHSISMANNSGLSQLTVKNTGSGPSQDYAQPSTSVFVDVKSNVRLNDLVLNNSSGTIADGVRAGLFAINSSMDIDKTTFIADGGFGVYGLRISSDESNASPEDVTTTVKIRDSKAVVTGATSTCRGFDMVAVITDLAGIDSEVVCDTDNNIGFRLQAWGRGSIDGLDIHVSGLTPSYSIGAQFWNVGETQLRNFNINVTGSTGLNDGFWYGVASDFPENTFYASDGRVKVHGSANYQFGLELWSARPIISNLIMDIKGLDANTKSRGISFGYDFNTPITPQNSVMQLNHSNINVSGIHNEAHALAGSDFNIEINNSTLTTSDRTVVFWPSNFAVDSEVIIRNSTLKSANGAVSVDLYGADGMGQQNAIILNSHLSGIVYLAGGTVIPTATCAANTTGAYQFLANTCPL